jgi:hypothetical protein
MLLMQKLFIMFAILIFNCWVTVVPVGSAGIVFDWQPFVVNANLVSDGLSPDIFLNKLSVSREMLDHFDDVYYLLRDDTTVDNESSKAAVQKSTRSRIKVGVSQVNSFMLSSDEKGPPGKDGKPSETTNTVTSFFKNPSQETAVQTIKLIQPQLNLGFEF